MAAKSAAESPVQFLVARSFSKVTFDASRRISHCKTVLNCEINDEGSQGKGKGKRPTPRRGKGKRPTDGAEPIQNDQTKAGKGAGGGAWPTKAIEDTANRKVQKDVSDASRGNCVKSWFPKRWLCPHHWIGAVAWCYRAEPCEHSLLVNNDVVIGCSCVPPT